jgi:hypothetical protein
MGVFSSVLTGSLQGIAERPLPCSYNVIRPARALSRRNPGFKSRRGTPNQYLSGEVSTLCLTRGSEIAGCVTLTIDYELSPKMRCCKAFAVEHTHKGHCVMLYR